MNTTMAQYVRSLTYILTQTGKSSCLEVAKVYVSIICETGRAYGATKDGIPIHSDVASSYHLISPLHLLTVDSVIVKMKNAFHIGITLTSAKTKRAEADALQNALQNA